MRRLILGDLKENSRKVKSIRKAYCAARKRLLREFGELDYDIIFVNWRSSGNAGFFWTVDYGYVRINVGVDKILLQDELEEGICESVIYNTILDSLKIENKFIRQLCQNMYIADFLGWEYDEKFKIKNLSQDNLQKINEALNGNLDNDWLDNTSQNWNFYGFSKWFFDDLEISRKEILRLKEEELCEMIKGAIQDLRN